MNNLRCVLIAFALLVSAAHGRTQGATGAQRGNAPGPSARDSEALAREILRELVARQFDKISQRFNQQVAAILTKEKLSEGWDVLLGQSGNFRAVTGAEKERRGSLVLVYLTTEFERTSWEFHVAFDEQWRIASIGFAPVGMRGGWRAPRYFSPEKYQERQITMTSGRWKLPGTLTMPNGSGPFPAVVLVHCSGPLDEDETVGTNKPFKDLAGGLASRGIAVLRYAKRTFKYGKDSSDDPAALTLKEETVDDAVAAVALLAGMKEIDARHIFVVGHSLGAYAGPRIAAASLQVAGLILMAGNTRPIEDLVVEQVRYIAGLDGKITPEEEKQIQAAEQSAQEIRDPELKPGKTISLLAAQVPASYFLDLRNYRPAEAAVALKIPILVLQGERDYQVRVADFEGWKKALAGRANAQLKLYPRLNHLFMPGEGPSSPSEYLQPKHLEEEVVRDIAGWVAAQSKTPPPVPSQCPAMPPD